MEALSCWWPDSCSYFAHSLLISRYGDQQTMRSVEVEGILVVLLVLVFVGISVIDGHRIA